MAPRRHLPSMPRWVTETLRISRRNRGRGAPDAEGSRNAAQLPGRHKQIYTRLQLEPLSNEEQNGRELL